MRGPENAERETPPDAGKGERNEEDFGRTIDRELSIQKEAESYLKFSEIRGNFCKVSVKGTSAKFDKFKLLYVFEQSPDGKNGGREPENVALTEAEL